MGDAGEGLIDAEARIQERMEDLEHERAQKHVRTVRDPERLRALESLRLARTELERQFGAAAHERRRAQLHWRSTNSTGAWRRRAQQSIRDRVSSTTTAPSITSIDSRRRSVIWTGRRSRIPFDRSGAGDPVVPLASRRCALSPTTGSFSRRSARRRSPRRRSATSCATRSDSRRGSSSGTRAGRFASTRRAATSIRPRRTSSPAAAVSRRDGRRRPLRARIGTRWSRAAASTPAPG